MIIFHLHITSTFPLAVPLEWNLFMIFGILFLFGHYGDVPLSTLDDPLLIVLLLISGVLIPVLGNLWPDKVSFLPAMRYYAGNWATSQWLFRKDSGAEEQARRRDRQARADRRRAADQGLRPRDGRAAARQGPRLPRDALPRPGAQRPAAAGRSTTSRPTTCARAS